MMVRVMLFISLYLSQMMIDDNREKKERQREIGRKGKK
jgi:hypothetical protein